jgi:serine/threonine protein phosphatase 1
MSFFRRLSRRSAAQRPLPRGHSDARLYAVGDIHGCLDLLDSLLRLIEEDSAARPPKKTYIVFLGDLIDRGPASAGVVERLRTYRPEGATPVFLAGNHEEIFARVLEGEAEILADWLKFGGAECLESYGVDPAALKRMDPAAAVEQLRSKVPQAHIDFIESFADTFRFGDYLFVHAGIRPGIDLAEQEQFDLRWIREPFLSFDDEHGLVVVHGHTIVDQVEERANRIGLDTGAYRSGVLTALAVEDDVRWYLSTAGSPAPAWAGDEAVPREKR